MLKTIAGLQGVNILSKDAQKRVMGGSLSAGGASGCGVKVDGNWHPSEQNASATSGLVGASVIGTDNQTWWSLDGGSSFIQGQYTGKVTNWCCDSCPWNKPSQYAYLKNNEAVL